MAFTDQYLHLGNYLCTCNLSTQCWKMLEHFTRADCTYMENARAYLQA